MDIESRHDLACAYTPGVAEPCKVIAEDPDAAFDFTIKANTVAVVTDGSAVLGLGNIGPRAALPSWRARPPCSSASAASTRSPSASTPRMPTRSSRPASASPPLSAASTLRTSRRPRCFEIERRLNDALDIPVFHDDQHGTAIVVLSGVINALRLTGKSRETSRVVVNGAGSAGIAIAKLLLSYGFEHLTLVDRFGIISSRYEQANDAQRAMLAAPTSTTSTARSPTRWQVPTLSSASGSGAITKEMVASMADDPIVFAMANPTPEIYPDEALEAGRPRRRHGPLRLPNQVNNVIAFPGIFKGRSRRAPSASRRP